MKQWLFVTDIDIHEISHKVHTEKKNWQPEVELPDLTQEQHAWVRKLLLEQCNVFSKNPNDIGDIKIFKWRLN